MTIQGRPTVVVWGMDELAGHDLETGRVLWRYVHGANHRMGSMVTSIVGHGDLLFLPLENGMIALSAAKLAAGSDPVVWTSRGGGSALTTPVLYEGRIYAVSAAGVATCTEAKTGDPALARAARRPVSFVAGRCGGTRLLYRRGRERPQSLRPRPHSRFWRRTTSANPSSPRWRRWTATSISAASATCSASAPDDASRCARARSAGGRRRGHLRCRRRTPPASRSRWS